MKNILLFSAFIFISSCIGHTESHRHKYRIDYSDGRVSECDFTDEYSFKGECITYKNSRNREVIRCGSFAIIDLK